MCRKLVYLMAFVLLLGVTGSVWAVDSLVAHWEFKEGSGTVASDSVGDNDGTLVNMEDIDWGDLDCPELGSTLSFDGSDEYVQVDDDAALNFGAGPFSIAFWMKNLGGDSDRKILIKGSSGAPGSGKRYVVYVSGNHMMFDIDDNVTKSYLITEDTIVDANWHHVVCRRIPAGGIDLYFDGVQEGAVPGASATGNIDAPGEPLLIARSSFEGSSSCFYGLLSDVRLYNYALDPDTEIPALANYESLIAWCPDPADGVANVALNTDLSWAIPTDVNERTEKYRVYFSTDSTFASVTPVVAGPVGLGEERASVTNGDIGGPLSLGTYYWRVDSYDPNATPVYRIGDVWTFDAGATLPVLVAPADTYSPDVEINEDLEWTSDSIVTTHNLIITPEGESAVTVTNVTSPFNPYTYGLTDDPDLLTMAWEKKYEWQIIEKDGSGSTLAEGPIWKFEVRPLACIGMNSDIDGSEDCIVNLADFAMLASEWLDCNWNDGGMASPCP